MIQMDILNEFHTALTYLVPVYVHGDYNDATTLHAIQTKLHEQQCSLEQINTMHYLKYYTYVYKPS